MAEANLSTEIDPTTGIGPDATATFDKSPSNPTEHASSEALGTAVDDEADEESIERDDEINAVDEVDEPADEDAIDDESLMESEEEGGAGNRANTR